MLWRAARQMTCTMRTPEALNGRRRLSGEAGNEWCRGSRTGLGWAGTERPQLEDRRACHSWYVDPVDAPPEGALQRQYGVCSSGCAPCVYGQHPDTGKYRCMMGGCPDLSPSPGRSCPMEGQPCVLITFQAAISCGDDAILDAACRNVAARAGVNASQCDAWCSAAAARRRRAPRRTTRPLPRRRSGPAQRRRSCSRKRFIASRWRRTSRPAHSCTSKQKAFCYLAGTSRAVTPPFQARPRHAHCRVRPP